MNLLLLEPGEIPDDGRVVLTDRRATHAREVLDVSPGDQVRVGVIRGARGTGTIIARSDERIEVQVDLHEPASPSPAIDLILAVPRPKAVPRILRAAACLGVRRIDLVNAWRVDKSYLSSHELAPRALRDNLLLGCEQGMTTWLPDIHVHRMLMPFIREHLEPRLQAIPRSPPGAPRRSEDRLVVADPDAEAMLEEAVPDHAAETARHGSPTTPALIAAIGPERGWIPRELDTFVGLGGKLVSLGAPTLTVEVAVTALLAQLMLLNRVRTSTAGD